MRLTPLLILTACIAGCVQFPEIDDATDPRVEQADYPTLVPLDPILASVAAPAPETAETEAELEARIAGLRARAARLRGAGLSSADRNRLDQDVQ